MSIKVMTMVFDRYPEGGNERLLALAMADHSKDDGTRIWPSVAELARKTMQSRSTVQRQIKRMVDRGWLEPVHHATGRPGDTNEYRINAAWIAGGCLPETGINLTPVPDASEAAQAVDNLSTRVSETPDTGVKNDGRGVIAVTPESSEPSINRIPPLPPVATGGSGKLSTQQPVQVRRCRPGWRWRESFDGVCKRGVQLGLPYSLDALGNAWTDDQLTAHQAAYRRLVDAADAHAVAVADAAHGSQS